MSPRALIIVFCSWGALACVTSSPPQRGHAHGFDFMKLLQKGIYPSGRSLALCIILAGLSVVRVYTPNEGRAPEASVGLPPLASCRAPFSVPTACSSVVALPLVRLFCLLVLSVVIPKKARPLSRVYSASVALPWLAPPLGALGRSVPAPPRAWALLLALPPQLGRPLPLGSGQKLPC